MYTSMYGSVVIYIQYIYVCVLVIYICLYINICLFIYLCIHIYMHMSVYIIQFISTCVYVDTVYIYIYIPCLYACMYACIYRFLYIFSRPSFFLSFLELLFSRRSILEFKTVTRVSNRCRDPIPRAWCVAMNSSIHGRSCRKP